MPGDLPPLLVTCPGAYADSGLGTGGCVLLHDGRAHVIDRADTTGIWEANGLVFRFSRARHAVTATDAEGVRLHLRLPEARDVHDIVVRDDEILCVCSGSNEALWFDLYGRLRRRWKAPGEGDAWHLNCVWPVDGRLYASAFGDFRTHRGWSEGCMGQGFIFDLESGEQVVTGLSGPHNPRFIDGAWCVCDSHARSLLRVEPDGTSRRVDLGAFTRGLAFDDRHLYVGESADRKTAGPDSPAYVAILDRKTLKLLSRLEVPFPEIYEILVIGPDMAERIARTPERFAHDPVSERIKMLEFQVKRGEADVRTLRAELQGYRESLIGKILRRISRAGR